MLYILSELAQIYCFSIHHVLEMEDTKEWRVVLTRNLQSGEKDKHLFNANTN